MASCTTAVGRRGEVEGETGQGTQGDFGGWQEANRGCTTGTVGKDPGREMNRFESVDDVHVWLPSKGLRLGEINAPVVGLVGQPPLQSGPCVFLA